MISIHAPLVGCDAITTKCWTGSGNFNPRTPRGVRRLWFQASCKVKGFQSTHPSWGATLRQGGGAGGNPISIHAPLVGCDQKVRCKAGQCHDFNPRTPRGVRRVTRIWTVPPIKFQSTHPSWGATVKVTTLNFSSQITLFARSRILYQIQRHFTILTPYVCFIFALIKSSVPQGHNFSLHPRG